MEASVLDLRKKMSKVMDALDRNERVILTRRGRQSAIIIPITEKKKAKIEDLPGFGIWSEREDMTDPVTYVEKNRESRF